MDELNTNTNTIIEAIGRKELAKALGIKTGAISAASVANQFPASWYKTIRQMGHERGLAVPDRLFNWKAGEK